MHADAALEAEIEETGAAQLVAGTGNGPPCRSAHYTSSLRRHRIIRLRRLPRTLQHNAGAERAVRGAKAERGLGKGRRLSSIDVASARVAVACERLEQRALVTARPTPLTVRYTAEERERFYDTACSRIEIAVHACRNAREQRMAEREAGFAEQGERGFIKRARGGAPMPASKAGIS